MVSTFVQGPNHEAIDTISVVVEVMGCWNRDLLTSMENQLLNRYLKDNACRTGIYLVGWFWCEQWDSSDYRKTATPNKSVEEISQILESQAKDLSKDGNHLHSYVLNAALRP